MHPPGVLHLAIEMEIVKETSKAGGSVVRAAVPVETLNDAGNAVEIQIETRELHT